jgi:outer membrane protein assembly factor BamD
MMSRYTVVLALVACFLTSCGFHRKKYDNPITKDTKQPDKVLYDRAINDIEHGRYEVARITLNTLINTYDQSEFLAKAKLAVADSWFREGGTAGFAQAEAEYKDFILFYPTMAEAAESQEKICMIHYKQMDKSDRDVSQALRAEDECRQLVVQFPNSQFVPETQQLIRNIQEALANGEFLVGDFYYKRGASPASANRFSHLVDQYPLYSKADQALFELGEDYERMGPRFRKNAGEAYARIVKEYPLSDLSDSAKKKLQELEIPVPEADPVAVARMKWEQENRTKSNMFTRATTIIRRGPDMSTAAKSGQPAMTALRPTVPVSVPSTGGVPGFTGDVTATTVGAGDASALEKNPDARGTPPAAGGAAPAAGEAKPGEGTPAGAAPAGAAAGTSGTGTAAGAANPQAQQTTAADQKKAKKKKKEKKPKDQAPAANPPATNPPATSQSNPSSQP